MWARQLARALLLFAAAGGVLGTAGAAVSGPTVLEETSPLVWVILAIAVGGALITYAFLFYALWRYRDPATRRRRYG